ncbi:MAG: PilZ domain-containing protein [Proteobacteria bacterium]|nr:PilZ domain-containing protein [Pseudomonadota bacterium]
MSNNDKSKLAGELVNTISARAGGRHRAAADEQSGSANRRQHPRFPKPTLAVAFGRVAFPTKDWSLGGACIIGSPVDARANASQPVAVVIGQRQFPATARIRRQDTRQLGLEFTAMPPETRAALGRLVRT